MTGRIPLTRPVIGHEEIDAVARVLQSGYLVQGRQVAEFERLVAEASGTAHAVAVTNCTAALGVALHALGVGAGDRVVVAPYSWPATANVIELAGAVPVFVDVDAETFNLDADRLAAALESDGAAVKAAIAVHTFGNPAGMRRVAEVLAAAGVPLIEDAACALGADEDGRAAGGIGMVGCFSFHPRKIVTTGEGGMLVTDDERIADVARARRNHGQLGTPAEFVTAGDNLRLTEMQGAMGVVQMARLRTLVDQRAALAARYDDLIRPLGYTPQRRSAGAAVQSYVARVPASLRAAEVIDHLRAVDIECTIGTIAIPFVRYYRERYGVQERDLPVTAGLGESIVTLPLYPGMPESEQDRVVERLAGLRS